MVKIEATAAKPEHWHVIKALVTQSPWNDALAEAFDWSDIGPYWLIAFDEDHRIVGCVQMLVGKPLARIELLCVDERLDHPVRARAIRTLILRACEALRGAGAKAVAGTVPFALKSYKRVLKKRGAETMLQGNVMMLRFT